MTFVQTSPHNATSPQDLPGFDPPHSSRSALAAPSHRHPVTPSPRHPVTPSSCHRSSPPPVSPFATSPRFTRTGWIWLDCPERQVFPFSIASPGFAWTYVDSPLLTPACRASHRSNSRRHESTSHENWSDLVGFTRISLDKPERSAPSLSENGPFNFVLCKKYIICAIRVIRGICG